MPRTRTAAAILRWPIALVCGIAVFAGCARAGDDPPPAIIAWDATTPAPEAAADASAAAPETVAAAPPASSLEQPSGASVGASVGASAGNGVTAPPDEPATAGDAVPLAVTPTMSIPRNETVVAIPTPTATPGAGPMLGGCPVMPADNPWNEDISQKPVDPNSAAYISRINATRTTLHPDFGGNGAYGIPFIIVPQNQPMTNINWTDYGDESDPGPYPIPLNAPIEGGGLDDGDRHVIALQQGTCKLYELFHAYPRSNYWDASSGAIFDLRSNALRPDTWTSADAAGLPILPGLVRYDEVQSGEIRHAVRFTVNTVRKAWVHPATHYGTSTDPLRIPYGAKLRLKANYDISGYHGQTRVILEALKKYGMIVADQGSSWFITGAADPRWDDDDLNQLKGVPGSAFEVVQLGQIYTYP